MCNVFKYADLLDDEVFKLVFGQESTKDVMIEFLNQVITDRRIIDLEFMDKEMHPTDFRRKRSVYDLLCKTDDGSRVIVEVQRRKQDAFIERTLYYSTFQIAKQVEAGASEYDFCPVYVVNILEFTLDQNADNSEVRTMFRLYEEKTHTLLTDRVTFIFLELPKFRKSIDELNDDVLEGMYFCLKNMPILQEQPKALKHRVFDKIFEMSELLRMNEETRLKVLDSMTTERDLQNQFAYARKQGFNEGREEGLEKGIEEGREVGREEGRMEMARKLKALGVDVTVIMEASGLSEEQIADL